MKALDLATFVAVFQEMLGLWFWVIVAGAVLGAVLFAWVIATRRSFDTLWLARAEIAGPIGGFAAVGFALLVTQSHIADIGGPVDWVLLAVIWTLGAIGTVIFGYVAQGLMARRSQA
jgi:hypothetical protein